MKKILFVLIALCFVNSLAFAEDAATTAAPTDTAAVAASPVATAEVAVSPEVSATPAAEVAPAELTLKGDVIDNMCAGMNKDNLALFVKTHSKECTLKPACMESGYSIFSDGKLYRFDKESNAKVAEFLKTADSKLQVAVTAKQVGDELNLVSIENQN